MNAPTHSAKPARCPEPDRLSNFFSGKLPATDLERTAAHLDTCELCRAALAELEKAEEADSVIEALRSPPNRDPFSESEQEQIVAVVSQLAKEQIRPAISDSVSIPHLPPALQEFRDYKLLEPLGRGSMGVVYKALHTRLNKLVAVKLLPCNRVPNSQAVARFRREIEAVGRLEHPHIVRAMNAGIVEGVHFLVMEYVDGIEFSKLVQVCGPLAIADACELIRQAALGLQESHRQGLVHRDVKPPNLILATDGQVKLLDLGLVHFDHIQYEDDEITEARQLMGTPDYMAPEQARESRDVDARADIYSLGCTFYKLLTGNPPFSGPEYDTPVQKLTGHARDPVPPVDHVRPDVPPDIVSLLAQMLSKHPDTG